MRYVTILNGIVDNVVISETTPPRGVQSDTANVGDLCDGESFTTPTPTTTPLSETRARIWTEIKAYRTARLDGGFFYDGHWYHSDDKMKIEFNTLKLKALEVLIAAGDMDANIIIDGTPIKVKTIDNGYLSVSYNQILGIVTAGEVQTKRTYETAATHEYYLNISPTPESYNWHTGWPDIYEAP